MSADRARVRVAGRELIVSNLEKVIYPAAGTTKADVMAYYAAVAGVLLPGTFNRPATRKRWVHGVGTEDAPGEMFFQKNLDDSAPGWVSRVAIAHKEREIQYPLVNDAATLAWLGQVAALEIHVPQWRVDSGGLRLPPDRLVLDLDPGPGAGLAECAQVALLARDILQDIGLDPVPVTSGSKGIHLYAALDGTQNSDQVSAFAHELARSLEADHPDLALSEMKRSLRTGKVLVDWSQNSAAKTTIAPYSLRGLPTPTVAAPRTWDELAAPALAQLDYLTVMQRVTDGIDPLVGVVPLSQQNGGPHKGGDDPLRSYTAMRDPARTPEPFGDPATATVPPPGTTFVIQEHHASSLHYDFRLEHDGVLVSWAIPKGIPGSSGTNHLAIQTEDHPLAYGSFAGTIPPGEYGAGTVRIWDSGTYETHKWVNGREVIATLTGAPDGGLGGRCKFALIRTRRPGAGGQDGGQPQWLIHRMEGDAHRFPTARTAGENSDTAPDIAAPPLSGTSAPLPTQFADFAPMLAGSGSVADLASSLWQYELKWDGVRALIHSDGSRVRIFSRSGREVSATYPEFADPALWPQHAFIADGEIIALGARGTPDFGLLQGRMKLTAAAEITRGKREIPLQLMLFDLPYDGGHDLRALPLQQRRLALERLMSEVEFPVQVSPLLDEDVAQLLDSARELGLEGVVAKRRGSRYVTGQRTHTWLKLKVERTQEVVVGGWRPGNGARSATVGSLLVGVPEDGELRYVGRVGSGFTDRQLAELRKTLDALARKTPPLTGVPPEDMKDAHWVSASLVGEVRFGEWTATGRLRHPVWRGWRLDKAPSDVIREP